MIKKVFGFVMIVCIAGVMNNIAYAQERKSSLTNKIGIGGYGNIAFQRIGNFDTGFGGGAYIKYMPIDYAAIEASYDIQVWDFSTDVDGATGTLEGDFLVMPMSFTGLLTYPLLEGKLYPYAGAGVDVLFIGGDATGTLSPGGDSKVEYDNAFGVHVSSGIDYVLTENLVFNFDVKYTWCEPDVSTSTSQAGTSLTIGDDLFDNLALRVGLSYYF